ncbi:MAG: hypothetical protein ACRDDX_11240 [Cellulosilyticaceae bacterium]
MQLTSKEKNLLYILAFVATLVVCVRFIMMPSFEKHSELEAQLEVAKQQEADMQMKLAAGAGIDEEIEATILATEEMVVPFFKATDKEYIQRWIMDMTRQAGVEVKNLTLSDQQITQVSPYTVSITNPTYAIGTFYQGMVNANGEVAAEGMTGEVAALPGEGSDQVIRNSISLSLKGNQQNILNFVHNLSAMDKHVIVENLPMAGYNEPAEKEVAINVSIYSIHKENDGHFDKYAF